MDRASSLDQQYLDFNARTSTVFAQYPQLESLRHFVFKDLLSKRVGTGWEDSVKHWLRPFVRVAHTNRSSPPADVVVLVESHREVIVESLVPLYRELKSRGLNARLVSLNGPAHLPEGTIRLRFPANRAEPSWATPAWEGLCDSVEGLRGKSLRRSFLYASTAIGGLLDEVDRVLQFTKPRIVLVASTQLSGGAAFAVSARTRAATAFLLQHGILQPFYIPIIADKMLTWGESSNETLMTLGIPAERLLALGSPRHDSLMPIGGGRAREELLRVLALPERPTFVFFSNGNDLVRNGTGPELCARWLEGAASSYSDEVNIVVKLHPNEDGSLYRNCSHLTISSKPLDLGVLLEGADWVGSLCSTVLYDALPFRKPVWQFYADGWPELADNWKRGLATRIESEIHLCTMVGKALKDGLGTADKGWIARVFANHGYATRAVANFVERSVNNQKAF